MSVFSFLTNKYLSPRRKKTTISSLLFSLVFGGIFILVGAGVLSTFLSGDHRTSEAEGVVVDIETSRSSEGNTMYSPVIGYQVDGVEYRVTRNMSSSFRPDLGDEYDIKYDPNNPSDGAVPITIFSFEFWLTALFPLAGALTIGFSIYGFVRSILRTKEINRLLSSGHSVKGVLVDIKAHNTSSKKQTYYQLVVAAAGLDGQVTNYLSDKLVGLPVGLVGMQLQSAAVPIDVFIDVSDEKKYYVDLADIPTLTPERIQDLIKTAASGFSNAQNEFETQAAEVAQTTPVPRNVNKQLVDYISSQRSAGYADDVIRTNLRNAGWAEDDINQAF